MIYYISYANEKFRNSQAIATKSAKKRAKVDKIIEYNEDSIDKKFKKENAEILNQKRGNGFWLWKPYLIKKTLDEIDFEDYIIYADSGAYILHDVRYLIEALEKTNQDLMCFQLPLIESMYSKRDAFILMDCDSKKYYSTYQNLATFILIKKTKKTLKFVEEWLNYAKDKRIITDQPNTCGKNNYNSFIDNRHDQTIFSLLTKKYGYVPFRDPSQYGNKLKKTYTNSEYPQMFFLHRCFRCKTKIGTIIYRKIVNLILLVKKNNLKG